MRSKRTRQRYGILIIPIIFIGFFLIGSLAGQYFNPNFGPASGGLFKKKPSDKIILLYGVDARNKNESSRSDTMILAFIHPQINRIDLLSVPRDSRVSIPGEDHDRKINYANAKGGSDLLIETIEGLLEINIDGYIQVDFEGFEDLIDTMGGVDLSVEKRMYYPAEDIDLMAGKQHLDGHDALAYVRYRSDGMGDIGRIQRQQKFMRAFIRQAAGAEA
ncbi:MAG: LCP family protein, partial [Chitinophagales bacterium]